MNKEPIKAQVRDDEGWDAFPYEDHLGFLTIGYGFVIDPRKTGGLPRPVAEFWLDYLVDERITGMRRRWPPFDKQHPTVQLALLNMSYQLGVGGVLNFKRMIQALERGDRKAAKAEALDSKWARQTPERARRVAAAIGGG